MKRTSSHHRVTSLPQFCSGLYKHPGLYILLAGPVAFLPARYLFLPLALWVSTALGIGPLQEPLGVNETDFISAGLLLVGVGILTPLAETLLMIPVFALLRKVTARPLLLALCSSVVWASLHSLSAATWGITVIWQFFVFSCSFLVWEKRSKGAAVVVTATVHAMVNLTVTAMLLLQR